MRIVTNSFANSEIFKSTSTYSSSSKTWNKDYLFPICTSIFAVLTLITSVALTVESKGKINIPMVVTWSSSIGFTVATITYMSAYFFHTRSKATQSTQTDNLIAPIE